MRDVIKFTIYLNLLIVGVSAFIAPSPSAQIRNLKTTSGYPSVLRATPEKEESPLFRRRSTSCNNSPEKPQRSIRRLQRSIRFFCASVLFWFGAAGLRSTPSIASTADVAPATQPSAPISSSLDKIVDRYVQHHMFDDDVYDPIESTYREAMNDNSKGSHPKKINEITAEVFGQDVVKAERKASASGIGGLLLDAVNLLQKRGLSETTAVFLLAGTFVVVGPGACLVVGMMVGSQSKRQINNVMKKRYGDTYTVDATIKTEDDVELPDDDDEDDEEEDDDDDEGDDDE
ncbi:unnamed protein product [Cylindrotheca closterium]|uniref:Uncharacterized protein n=1 Tax=Cylindrotheca closterium TaxID=2856 RepID=A0AAD2G698_9STRA|nr:unnamed protein product [Cylindrotheca closterium]